MSSDEERFASQRLAALLRQEIETGALAPGDPLPSYRKLSSEHSVAINTAQAAVRLLEAAGLVDVTPGKGAFVRQPIEREPLAVELQRLHDRLSRTQTELADTQDAVAELLARLPETDL